MSERTLLEARIVYSRAMGMLLGEINRLELDFILDQGKRSQFEANWNATHCAVVVAEKRCEQLDISHQAHHAFVPIGIRESVHILGLGQDLLLIEGDDIVNEKAAYEPLGTFWKGLDAELRWGGDFRLVDSGHFSHRWQGRQ